MSQRRQLNHFETTQTFTIRIVCSRGHRETVVARYMPPADPDVRRAMLARPAMLDSRFPDEVYTHLRLAHETSGHAHEGFGEEYETPDGVKKAKPRWLCRACGENVSVSARVADALIDDWARRGVSVVDLSDLSRTIGK